MAYKLIETESRRVHNEGEPTGFGLYLSTTKGKRRKYVADYSTIQDLDSAIQTYLDEGVEYISAIIIVRYTTGHNTIERKYIKV